MLLDGVPSDVFNKYPPLILSNCWDPGLFDLGVGCRLVLGKGLERLRVCCLSAFGMRFVFWLSQDFGIGFRCG